jgi:hypothetical protein
MYFNRGCSPPDGRSDIHVMLHVNNHDGFTIAVSENKQLARGQSPYRRRLVTRVLGLARAAFCCAISSIFKSALFSCAIPSACS